jgi:hypothetical protein
LEVGQGPLGALAQDAVDPAGVEAESTEPSLQVGHVVTSQRWVAPVEEPVAQPVAGLDQGGPGLLAADAVDPQAARFLKGPAGSLGVLVEAPARITRRVEPGREQPPLEVTDSLALAASAEREARYRN